jgi:hypothetical protein
MNVAELPKVCVTKQDVDAIVYCVFNLTLKDYIDIFYEDKDHSLCPEALLYYQEKYKKFMDNFILAWGHLDDNNQAKFANFVSKKYSDEMMPKNRI